MKDVKDKNISKEMQSEEITEKELENVSGGIGGPPVVQGATCPICASGEYCPAHNINRSKGRSLLGRIFGF